MPRIKLKELSEEQMTKIRTVMHRVWGQINSDIGDCDNVTAVEVCLDADRPEIFAGAEGKEVTAILDNIEETPTQANRFLAKRIQLA